jgi:hypothetical protein
LKFIGFRQYRRQAAIARQASQRRGSATEIYIGCKRHTFNWLMFYQILQDSLVVTMVKPAAAPEKAHTKTPTAIKNPDNLYLPKIFNY